MSQQIANHRTKAAILIMLVLSGGLVTPLSGGSQPNKYVSDSGWTKLSNQLMKVYSSDLLSASQKGGGFYIFRSNGETSATTASMLATAEENGLQAFQGISSPVPIQQLITTPNSGVLVLRDTQGGQNIVLVISLGQNVESSRVSPLPLLFAPLLGVWLDSERRRSRFRIYVEILDILKRGPMTPYEVAFHLRLNRKKAREYLDFLEKNAFLEFAERGDRAQYSITGEGRTFVENLKAVLQVESGWRLPESSS